ncbi:matrix Gla protein isoform X2 [Esox lucius]|uniref:matrix Gla protein isoform X2 n=1 Tax=Esox lucius TaxID=8010 RepID=UPI0009734195|nr:matrix Gla protein isoform X2 [Esox lucius]
MYPGDGLGARIQTAIQVSDERPGVRMRSLIPCVFLCVFISLCHCYDSEESRESYEDYFVSPSRANRFLNSRGRPANTPPRGSTFNNFNSVRKPPAEMRSEVCEDFNPCRSYARHFGSENAYRKYFGNSGPMNPRRI